MNICKALLIVLVAGAVGAAQAPEPAPVFEVASVKPNKSGTNFVNIGNLPGGRFNATNVTPYMLLRQAYNLQPSQIIGAPSWLESEHFDIVAKASGEVGPGQMPLMIRALMVDRFKLLAHTETRELQIYALVKARSDGKLGPQLKPSAVDCAAMRGRGGPPPGGPAGPGGFVGRGVGPGGVPAPPPPPGGPGGAGFGTGVRPPCAQMFGPASLGGGGMTMAQLANMLSTRVNRIIVDRTGLTGGFDLDLNWTPDQMPQGAPAAFPGAPPLPPIDPNGPSIFTAIQEQLGLKLDSTKGPADVLVIDSIVRPTDD